MAGPGHARPELSPMKPPAATAAAAPVAYHGRKQLAWLLTLLVPALITLAPWSLLLTWLGLSILPFLLAASFWANFQLTSANYIEDDGLRRQCDGSGRLTDRPACEQACRLTLGTDSAPSTDSGKPC